MKATVLAVLAFVCTHASAIDVTNLNDSGPGSLRDAVLQANFNPGPDTITFSVTGTIVLTSGQLSINGPLTITGPGAGLLTIDGNANSRIFSVFEPVADVCAALGSDFTVTVSGLTLRNAWAQGNVPGGAMFSEKTLVLRSMVFADNQAKQGGALSIATLYPTQTLTIEDVQFTGNIARVFPTSTSGTQGGALYISERCGAGVTGTGTPLTISRSVFSGNRVQPTTLLQGTGGAIEITGRQYNVAITDTRITGNSVDPPAVPPPGANYRGGGIRVGYARSLLIERSEISDNVADRQALAVFNDLGGQQTPDKATLLRVVNSTISGNLANGSTLGPAAVLLFGNVAAEFYNSTVSSNTTLGGGPGGLRAGTGPTVPPSASDAVPPTLAIRSTIFSGSPGGKDDIGFDSATMPSLTVDAQQSMIGLVQTGVTIAGAGNVTTTSPVLATLAFNGGFTRTHALLPGSPAINAGSNPQSLTTDQRGPTFPRTALGGIDMGAYEVSLTPLAGDWDGNGSDTIGVHFPTSGLFALNNTNAPGAASLFFGYGPIDPSWVPLSGDWDGDGTRTPGLYDPATGSFFLRNSSDSGPADLVFGYGPGGNQLVPLTGDWNGDGVDTIGLYVPANGAFFLRNSNSAGTADVVFSFGAGDPDVVPLTGDWDGDGTTTVGLYDTQTSTFFLRNSNSPGAADLAFSFGAPSASYVPVVGNWDGAAGQTIALYDRRTGVFFLRNANSSGAADLVVGFGPGGP